jgi:hypothetical protein
LTATLPLEHRNYLRYLLFDLRQETALIFFCPTLYPLHNLVEFQCGQPNETGTITMPTPLRLTKESLQSEGIYMLDVGTVTYLWVGTESDPKCWQALFNCSELKDIPVSLPEALLRMNSGIGSSCPRQRSE